jgi:Fe-S-cluster containining protein
MNKSRRVDPEICRTCGKCCRDFRIRIPKKGSILLDFSNLIRMSYMEGIKAKIEQDAETVVLVFDHPCKYYFVDEEGRHSCELIDDPCRPAICDLFPYPWSRDDECPHVLPNPEGHFRKGAWVE